MRAGDNDLDSDPLIWADLYTTTVLQMDDSDV